MNLDYKASGRSSHSHAFDLNSSSARGQHGSVGFIKPDLAAPGTEIVSAAVGMGKAVLLNGIQENLVTLVQGGALVVAIAFIVVNIIVDMLYLLLNPRIRSV